MGLGYQCYSVRYAAAAARSPRRKRAPTLERTPFPLLRVGMPIGNFAGRKLGNSDAPKWRQDMRLGRPPCVIDRLPTASLISLNVILNRVLDAERPLPRIIARLRIPR